MNFSPNKLMGENGMFLKTIPLLGIVTDPMDILYASDANNIPTLSSLDFVEIFMLIKTVIFIVALISIAFSLIGMLYIHNANMIAEKKKDITHKLWIVFLASSAVFLFNTLKNFFDTFFY